MVAHGIPYVAQASPHDPRDLVRKAAKALATDGPGVPQRDLALPARLALATAPESIEPRPRGRQHLLLAALRGRETASTSSPTGRARRQPLKPWLKKQGRFAHLFKPGNEQHAASRSRSGSTHEWDKLLEKCGEPEQTVWELEARTPAACRRCR